MTTRHVRLTLVLAAVTTASAALFAAALVAGSAVSAVARGGVAETPFQSDAASIVAAIRRADYEGDRDALRRLESDLAARDTSPADESRVHYWRGFALWRRAINAFNDAPDPRRFATTSTPRSGSSRRRSRSIRSSSTRRPGWWRRWDRGCWSAGTIRRRSRPCRIAIARWPMPQ
ncbi:MAG: hypothetical protein R2752_22735 [Vicinamibacterales bacterium]